MKKFKLLALALVIGSSSLFAMNVATLNENSEDEMRSELIKLLVTPDFAVSNDMTVVLKFTFNSQGEIVVLCAGCDDKKMVDYIRQNLNHKKFESPGIKDKIYKIPFTVKAG